MPYMNVSFAPKLLLLSSFCCLGLLQASAQEQAGPVTGTVRNEKGEPVESASVQVIHKGKGVYTGKTGTFSLLASPQDSLLISSVGYENLRAKVQAVMNLVLHPSNATVLNDVVVIGYGSAPRKELTGSVAVVTSKDFQQGSITTPEQLIAGKLAGVSITSNGGSPGSGGVIRIRGVASLNASNDPLIVIDGLPFSGNSIYGVSNALSLVNPNDIESFTVLKDAASTAIYGSRASNGVILITTKKGSSGRAVTTFNTQVSVSKLIKEADVLSPSQFRIYVDSLGTGSFDNNHTYKSLLGNANTDWQKEIYQTAISTDNYLSIAGNLDKMPYRISIGYLDQQGIVKTDHLQRFTAGISLKPSLFHDQLKLEINLKGAVSKVRFANAGAAISSAMYFDPTQPVHGNSPYGNYFEWASTDPGSGAITLNKLAPRNPVALLDLYNNSATAQRSFGNIKADYQLPFLSGLHANLNLGYDIAKGDGTIDVPAYAAQNFLDSGQHNKYQNKLSNRVGEFFLSYKKDIRSINSTIDAIAGYGYYDNLSTNYNYPNIRANGDTIPGSKPAFVLDKPQNTLISYYGRLIYTYNNKYILAASIRTDGSSRFSPSTRWGKFPSLAFTWRAREEKFLKSSVLSDLNVRLSYGVTGNQDGIYNYPYLPVYSFSENSSRVLFGNTYYTMGTPAAYDAGIKWEQTSSYNAGIDYGFLGHRLVGSIDVYYKKTKDLLNTTPVPAGSNFSSTILTNIGNMENKGIELAVNANVVKTKKWSWDLNFNIAYNTNKITNLTATKDPDYPGTLTGNGVIQINTVGYNANAFYVYHQQYDKTGRPIEGVYQDLNGDGIINQKDLYRYQSPFPKYILGFSTQIVYERWTLSTVLRGNIGNYMYNQIASNAIQANVLNPLGYLANVFSDIRYTHFYYSQPQSDYYIRNASFLKMDNLGLSYNAGAVFHNNVKLRINANCQNVFTVTRYTGQDPELYGGIDNTFYPRPRTYVLGVNLQF